MKAFVIAGEASGDALGADLMAGLSTLSPGLQIEGIGGARMQAAGLRPLYPMSDLSVMGLAEILPRYAHLQRRLRQTVEAVIAMAPDVLITIDSPDFCLRVAARVRRRAPRIRIVQYVAPSVWAWRPGRAARMARYVDQVLALLPFEPPYFQAHGLRCDFVGHPIASRGVPDPQQIEAFRAAHHLGDAPVLLALPGSRLSEITRLGPIFRDTLAHLARSHPDLHVIVPVAQDMDAPVAAATRDWPLSPLLLPPDAPDRTVVFAAADLALAASGSVSLELAAAGTPMVIAWRAAWLTEKILQRLVRLDTYTLVNLVSGDLVVPEFMGPACRADTIATALGRLLAHPDQQIAGLRRSVAALAAPGPGPVHLVAAQAVLDGFGLPSRSHVAARASDGARL